MKGVVFVELLQMAEAAVGEDAVDDVIDSLDLPSGGAYTTVGNYSCDELVTIVQAFCDHLNQPMDSLQNLFGRWMFSRFTEGYPEFFEGKTDAFTMLESIENEVHVEVRKLYPEVELPTFDTIRQDDKNMKMIYSSERPLIGFCQGMIEACAEHFNQTIKIDRTESSDDGKFKAEFDIHIAA